MADRVLIYRLATIGDTLVSVPCFHAIRRRFPKAQITLLTSRLGQFVASQDLLGGTGLVDDYIVYDTYTRDARQLAYVTQQLRQFNPEQSIYLMPPRSALNTARDAAFFHLCGVHRMVGMPFRRAQRTHRQLGNGNWQSEASRLADNIGSLCSVDLDNSRNWSINLSDAELGVASRLLASQRGKARKFVGLACGARHPEKDWGVNKWEQVLANITSPDVCLVLIGSADESERSTQVARHWTGAVINLCGQGVRINAAVLQQLDLLLCHDGGAMHLAASVETPCVAVFSNTNLPGVWFPFGKRHIVFHPGTLPLESVSTSSVSDAARGMLQ